LHCPTQKKEKKRKKKKKNEKKERKERNKTNKLQERFERNLLRGGTMHGGFSAYLLKAHSWIL